MLLNPTNRGLHLLGLRPSGDLGPLTGYTNRYGKAVWYLKAPPKTPPTCWQLSVRNTWRSIGAAWSAMPAAERAAWLELAAKSRLNITGYNLFTWYQINQDPRAIHTLEHISGINVIS